MSNNVKELIGLLTEEELVELKEKRREKHGNDKECCLGSGCSGDCIKKILTNRNKK
jgi:hypothetical protein